MTTPIDHRDRCGPITPQRVYPDFRRPRRPVRQFRRHPHQSGSDPRAVIVYLTFSLLSAFLCGGVSAWWVLR